MGKFLCIFLLGLPLFAQAYTGPELQEDCLAAESSLMGQKSMDVFYSVKSSRCLNYLEGFLDGYGVGEHLAGRIGVGIRAFCAPREERARLVRAVLAYLDKQPPFPPDSTVSAGNVVAAAFARAFECKDGE